MKTAYSDDDLLEKETYDCPLYAGKFLWEYALDEIYAKYSYEIGSGRTISPSSIYQHFARRFGLNRKRTNDFLQILKKGGMVRRHSKGYIFLKLV